MVDVITLELVRESLISVVQEMRINLTRTAYSSILYEGEDFSCVIMDPLGEIIAMSKGKDHPIHIFPVSVSLKTIRERFGDDINPGDIFLHNDTYTGGTHLNDIAMAHPVFLGGELTFFPVVRAHWADVGGMTYGSISGQATEVYQEGVCIPPIRAYDKGVVNEAALEIMFSNMRIRREREGDFRAMLGTCRMAEARLNEVADRFGLETLKDAIQELMDRNERRMRQAITELPPGEYMHEAYMEGGKTELVPQRVFLTLTVAEDQLIADFTGTAPQSTSPNNVGPGLLPAGVFAVAKSFLDSGSEINHGSLRPVTVIAPAGTLVNCRRPAPCGGSAEGMYAMEQAALGAIAPAIGGQVTGDIKGGANHTYIGGVNPRTEEPFVFYEYPAAGVGAFDGHDGNSVTRSYFESDITPMQPVEAVEHRFPLRVEHLGLREDSGGDGEWRGGLGCRRVVRILGNEAQLSVVSDHNIIPPFGVCGGHPGVPNRFSFIRDGVEDLPPSLPGKISGFPLKHGDIVLMQSSGGGGFGDPLGRDPGAVLEDVLEGYLSRERARDVYGVVLKGEVVDSQATLDMRQRLNERRPLATIAPWEGDEYAGGGRLIWLSPAAAERLGAREGDMAEISNPQGAPLRGWVRLANGNGTNGDGAACYLGETGKKILRVGDGASVELRRLHFEPVNVSQSVLPYSSRYDGIG